MLWSVLPVAVEIGMKSRRQDKGVTEKQKIDLERMSMSNSNKAERMVIIKDEEVLTVNTERKEAATQIIDIWPIAKIGPSLNVVINQGMVWG